MTKEDVGRVAASGETDSRASHEAPSGLHPSGFDPARGPWLIWSDYHGAWHRRYEDGEGREHAAGYTYNILEAGVFGERVARGYHDDGRNVAMPLAAMRANVEAKVLGLEVELVIARRLLDRARAVDPNTAEVKSGADVKSLPRDRDASEAENAERSGAVEPEGSQPGPEQSEGIAQ